MTRHYNTRHDLRGTGHYPARLARRGLAKTPLMESLDSLRARQERRMAATGVPGWRPGTAASETEDTDVAA
jgi:hypothetical protein